MSLDNQDLSTKETVEKKRSILSRVFGPWTFFILLVAAGVFLYLRNTGEEVSDMPRERPPVAVEIVPVAETALADMVRAVGSLRPIQNVEIKPEVGGRIKSVLFQEGGFVSKNKLLFEIEEQKHVQRLTSSKAALEQSRTRLENLQRNYERLKNLYEQDLISEDEFDRTRTEMDAVSSEVKRLAAQVELSREELSDTLLRAPFSGYISLRMVDPGAFVSQGQLLATMYQTDPLEISFMVPEKYSATVEAGQRVMVEITAFPEEQFEGKVRFVSPSIDESTRNFEVRAVIDNPENRLKPGSFASALLILGYREASMIIPERSLVATRDGYLVFVLDKQKERVESRQVRTGVRRPGIVEILQGLTPGDLVVVAGHMNLNDGMMVRVIEEAGPDWSESNEQVPVQINDQDQGKVSQNQPKGLSP